MPAWIRNSLFALVLLSCAVIGARVYQGLNSPTLGLPVSGAVSGMPEALPAFVLNDTDGEPRAIAEWAGRPLMLNFWATWCAPCRREIPLLQALHTEQGQDGLQIIGIAIDRLPDVTAFIGEYGVSYVNLVGQEDAMAVSDLFGLADLGLPFTVLAAADGQILTVHIGEVDVGQLREMVAVQQDYAAGVLDAGAARTRLAKL